ncbi:DUF1641 domain-containing protein [Haloferax sp. MBLA0076]|uniref:DUF1641 domain-containing protein n=1 Tax=Haloferax litoreum TaxID=2666140 RepID=A0A6A8GI94_9EURY|nr:MULTISPECIES: DUF1641 domain-containing protein [Haloferax]KAB1193339.1 DUF1641 domain-containing protein [Haloferax sp. CBA1148]MRX21847.1 DUF1641 domain-containing protein [Haloferax litoreum]
MASENQALDGMVDADSDTEVLAQAIERNADELAELLELMVTAQDLAADLTPELRETVRENREPIRELRIAFEREETLRLFQKVGDEADTLVELLDVLAVSQRVADELVPGVLDAVRENRDVVERLRFALEREETIVLVERLGENMETFVELVDLLDATTDLAEELVPGVLDATRENRHAIEDLRMAAAGFADGYADHDVDMYELGHNAANVVALTETLGDPQVTEALEATLGAFADDDPKPVGLFGLLGALFDADVRRALGRLVAAARALGRVGRE